MNVARNAVSGERGVACQTEVERASPRKYWSVMLRVILGCQDVWLELQHPAYIPTEPRLDQAVGEGR